MKQAIWSQKYNINTLLVNPQKKLGLFGLLNLIQDTAWIHATHLGHGYEEMVKENTAWVLTRQKVRMRHWPAWGDDIVLRTWIRPITGLIAIRDFEILKDGNVIGECTTQWLILNLQTRRPAEKGLELDQNEFRQDSPVFLEATRIPLQQNLTELAQFHVRNSDLDLNGHVNNTRYAQWILDSLSQEKHHEYILNEYEVNFIAETKSGETISIFSGIISKEKFIFQGVRNGDNKIVFAATLQVFAH